MASPPPAPPPHKHSCLLCSRRKIKCDKQDPKCSNCTKSHADCIYQAPPPPQRHRKRQADEDLIARLNHYEELLRSHKIDFKPSTTVLTPQSVQDEHVKRSPSHHSLKALDTVSHTNGRLRDGQEHSVYSSSVDWETRSPWASLSNELRNPPILRLPRLEDGQTLINGSPKRPLGMEAFLLTQVSQEQRHPEPRHIFRLWQIFVENVNPLTKILHVPTFQQRIFEVSWNIPSISKPTQAIMFAVYTLAIGSLSPSDCLKLFDQDKNTLFEQYRKSTVQSLIAAELSSTRDIEVLQAFVLFLLSDPESDSTATLTALAVRIAQKMGMDREKPPKISFFETEMRIRLWWQIRGLDARSRHQLNMCIPSPEFGSHVRLPLNVNDSELHPNMAEEPTVHTGTTEMLYCLLKHEVGQWFRTSALASKVFLKPRERLRDLSTSAQPLELKDQAIKELETIYTEKYLRHCDPRIPLHFISLSISQLALCRMRFNSHHPRNQPDGGAHMSQSESDLVFENGIRVLELDIECCKTQFSNQLLSTMVAKSQVDAIIFVLSELRRRPTGNLVTAAWKVIGKIYEDHSYLTQDTGNTFYVALGDLTLSAWETRQRELLSRQGARIEEITPPYIYSLMATRKRETADINTIPALGSDGFPVSSMLGLSGDGHLPGGWDPNAAFSTNFSMPSEFGTDPLDWGYWNEFLQV
ncbi:hypothetical protein L207DRAFT_558487 [Hyaloscypha variabilis F]|uniref:Zn(2)-C6 fungal-type domain-containing protein n=1 Tax=Hyaloscypha variabilis (strain UAMH 11265 / GT02V1 / F) TaxID=1149755 RepID=A0A2J6QZM7_HYAVF|nr:hypothetical protein L207DRAFT_558487 [Hyaloscypha variabilis F]